ncbi:MAG: glycosyltransferase family 2 protein [Rikenellaceae bacterium]
MLASIIIPTYKPQYWFDECLSSIARQTLSHDDFEVIIILNGDLSYKNYTVTTISKYRETLNIIFLETEFGNVSNARNMGFDIAKGEFILFIDSDDIISPNYLSSIIKVSTSTSIGVSFNENFIKNIESSYKTDTIKKKERNMICNNNSFAINHYIFSNCCCKCISKHIIGKIRFNIGFELGEDGIFMLAISSRIKQLTIANTDCIYYIRQTENSLSRKKYPKLQILTFIVKRVTTIIHIYLLHSKFRNTKLFLRKILSTFNTINRVK